MTWLKHLQRLTDCVTDGKLPTNMSDGAGNAITSTDMGGGKRALDVNTELTATIDPAGLATEATLAEIQADIAAIRAILES